MPILTEKEVISTLLCGFILNPLFLLLWRSGLKKPFYTLLFFYLFIFNWRRIALQYCVDFCHISTWTSHRYAYVPSLLTPPHLSRQSQHTRFELAASYSKFCLFCIRQCVCFSSAHHPTLSSPTTPTSLFMSASTLLPCEYMWSLGRWYWPTHNVLFQFF